jgi:hypothetical protein
MTNLPPDSYVDQDAEARHHALLSLHALSGAFGDLGPTIFPGFTPASPGTAMQTLAAAPEQEIPVSARLAVLFNLARAGLPHYESYEGEYRLLADSVAQSRGLDVDQLLIDLKESARGIPFSGTSRIVEWLGARCVRYLTGRPTGRHVRQYARARDRHGRCGGRTPRSCEREAPAEKWVRPRRLVQRSRGRFHG